MWETSLQRPLIVECICIQRFFPFVILAPQTMNLLHERSFLICAGIISSVSNLHESAIAHKVMPINALKALPGLPTIKSA